jgi:preprotein translocase SecF subunit
MSGFAAVIALLHDVIVMFALTVICRVQINTAYVAAMITIIAYSINNTIIVFDRCREYLKPLKGQKNIDYTGIGDMAVRDTLTRSIYTTLTTMVTVVFLAILGGETIIGHGSIIGGNTWVTESVSAGSVITQG